MAEKVVYPYKPKDFLGLVGEIPDDFHNDAGHYAARIAQLKNARWGLETGTGVGKEVVESFERALCEDVRKGNIKLEAIDILGLTCNE